MRRHYPHKRRHRAAGSYGVAEIRLNISTPEGAQDSVHSTLLVRSNFTATSYQTFTFYLFAQQRRVPARATNRLPADFIAGARDHTIELGLTARSEQ